MKREAWSRFISEYLTELFYPRLCAVCQKGLTREEKFICSACLADFPLAHESFHSETAILDSFDMICRPEALYTLFYYNKYSDYRNLIYAIKYHSHKQLGVYLGRMLGEMLEDRVQVDVIVPVPLHPRRERKRGFNQSRQIAMGISEYLRAEILDEVVYRVRNNVSQTGLSVESRQKNTEDIFLLKDEAAVRGKHILVVDDVVTTGATVRSCIKVLAEAGDVRFSLACLARTQV